MGDAPKTTIEEENEKRRAFAEELARKHANEYIDRLDPAMHLVMADQPNFPRHLGLDPIMKKYVELANSDKYRNKLASDFASIYAPRVPDGIDNAQAQFSSNENIIVNRNIAINNWRESISKDLAQSIKEGDMTDEIALKNAKAAMTAVDSKAKPFDIDETGLGGVLSTIKGFFYDDKKGKVNWGGVGLGLVGLFMGSSFFSGNSLLGVIGGIIGAIGLAWIGSKFTFDHTPGNTNNKDNKNEKGQGRTMAAGNEQTREQSENPDIASTRDDKYNMVARMGQIAKENGFVSPLARPAAYDSNEPSAPKRTPTPDKSILWAGLDRS